MTSCRAGQNDLELSDALLRADNPITSPSGLFIVESVDFIDKSDTRSYYLTITAKSDASQYVSEITFRYRDKNFILWADDGTDVLWAYNGDTGIYIFKHDGEAWSEEAYLDNNDLPVPKLLRELRPRFFE